MTMNVMVRLGDEDETLYNRFKTELKSKGIKPANGELFLILLRERYPDEQVPEVLQ